MRIVLSPVLYRPNLNGVAELTHRLASEYQRRGHSVLVVTVRYPWDLPACETIDGVPVRRIDYVWPHLRPRGLLRFATGLPPSLLTLEQVLRRFRPDVVDIHSMTGHDLYWLWLQRLHGFHLMVTLHGERAGRGLRYLRYVCARLLRAADCVAADSAASFRFVADLGPRRRRSAIIPNGVRTAEFAPPASSAGLVTSRPYLFALGGHVHRKGFDLLIDAFQRIAARYPAVDLVIGGDGPMRPELQRQAATYGLSDRVHLAGALGAAQRVAYYQHSLSFVMPTRYDSFGIVNLEAMASGKAVVATTAGGVPEVVRVGETGLLVPTDDAGALATAMASLLDEPARAAAMGETGRCLAQAYDWSRIAQRYLAVYQQLGV